ncbi:MAG TPA: hypothetical protein PKN75_15110 [Bacteroidia bacterium]|nr:hypothetical protein [Bacteroidia bacterium]HNU34914.1 hypothetical protein [Bacteroidia bacterium]
MKIDQDDIDAIYTWPQNPKYKEISTVIKGGLGETLYLKNITLSGRISLTNSSPTGIKQLHFTNISTDGDVEIVIAYSTLIQIYLSFRGEINGLKVHRNEVGTDNCSLILEKVFAKKLTLLSNKEYRGSNNNIVQNCQIDELEIIHLDCLITQKSEINKLTISGNRNITIKSESIIKNLNAEVNKLTFDNSTVKEKVKLNTKSNIVIENNSSIEAPLTFKNYEFRSFSIQDSVIKSTLEFEDCTVENFEALKSDFTTIKLKGEKLKTLFTKSKFISNGIIELKISGYEGSLILEGSEAFNNAIGSLIVNDSEKLELSISNYLITNLHVGPTSISDSIKWQFENTNFKSIILNRIDNKGIIDFINCNAEAPSDQFKIRYSKLGEINLLSTTFEDFNPFIIIGSNISGIKLLQSQLPEDVQKQGLKLRRNRKTVKAEMVRLKLVYSQLRDLYSYQGYSNNALHCRAKELNYYRLELLYGLEIKRFWTWIQLTLSRFTNNYGTNWFQAVLVTFLGFGVLTHWAYVHSFGYEFSFDPDWGVTKKLIGHYFKFMSPIRSFNYNHGLGIESNMAPIYDFIGRVLIAYGIYETIQAFRKHGRSSL